MRKNVSEGGKYYLSRTLSKGRVNVDEVDRRSLEREA